jgi:glutamate-ammonia-ligase adenylyltransferase
MALTRARVIVGSDDLKTAVAQAISDPLTRRRDNAALLRDVADMRDRLVQEKGVDSLWSLKQLRGGLVDVEFIVQYLVLKHGHEHPKVLAPSTGAAIAALGEAGVLDADTALRLSQALDLWHSLLGLLTLTISGDITAAREAEMSGALKADLVRAAAAKDFAQLESLVKITAGWVHSLFNELIAEPATDLPPPEANGDTPA